MNYQPELIDKIRATVPEFEERFVKHREEWPLQEAGPCIDQDPFVDFTAQAIKSKDSALLIRIFNLMEKEINGPNGDVVATCFFESLINLSSAGHFSSLDFVSYLGPESRKHCQAWDSFTGVKTKGL